MKIPDWDQFTAEDKERVARIEARNHAERRAHGTLHAKDRSWLCWNCDSNLNAQTGELILMDITLDDLKRIKDDALTPLNKEKNND